MKSLSAWTERQWDNVWPRTAEFRFDLTNTMVMATPDGAMAVAIAPWTSTGFHEDGTPFDRPGRATMVLTRSQAGGWLGRSFAHVAGARRAAGQPGYLSVFFRDYLQQPIVGAARRTAGNSDSFKIDERPVTFFE